MSKTGEPSPRTIKPHRSGTLQRQLLRSHLTIGAIGLIAVSLLTGFVLIQRAYSLRLIELREPLARQSSEVITGLHQSLAALRGWIVTGNSEFNVERVQAWNKKIEPALRELENLHSKIANSAADAPLPPIRRTLSCLREAQWWIADIAQTPGNEPARAKLIRDINPIADNIFSAITACIELEKEQSGAERHALLAAMADLRGFFTRCHTVAVAFVDQTATVDKNTHHRWLEVANRRASKLGRKTHLLSPQQQEIITAIQSELRAYERLTTELFSPTAIPAFNLARLRLQQEAVPLSQTATQLLSELKSRNYQLMATDAAMVTRLGTASLGLSTAVLVAVAGLGLVVSQRHATRLAKPIARLTEATRRMAAGNLDEDISVQTNGELGLLTTSFNSMRAQLQNEKTLLTDAIEQLRQQEQNLLGVFRAAPLANVMVDSDGRIVMASEEAESLFGYTEKALVGKPIEKLLPERYRAAHPDQRNGYFKRPTIRAMGTGRELFALHKSGREIPVEIGLRPVKTASGTYALCAVVDISQRKRTEALIIEARDEAEAASRAKSEFLANMSHEIRTPLNAVIGLSELVLQTKLDDIQRDYLTTVASSGESLLNVINDILDFSKIEAGKLELDSTDFAIRDVVGDVMKSLALKATSNNLDLTYRVAWEVPDMLVGDPTRLRQILTNLVGNSVKFTSAGQVHVELGCKAGEGDAIQLLCSVEDSGIGIAPEKQKKIFAPFDQEDTSTTRSYGGTGLGLSITQRLVEAMGGEISVESRPGAGSTFRFTANLIKSPKQNRQPWQEVLDKLPGARVLVVDDNLVNLQILQEMIEAHGLNVTTAMSGDEAFTLLKQAATEKLPFSVLISDVHMPEMSGFQLARKIRTDQAILGTPIILLTSSGDVGDAQRINDLGISAHLLKPVKQSELLEAVISALGIQDIVDVEFPESTLNASTLRGEQGLRLLLAEDSVPNQKLALALLSTQGHATVVAQTGREAVDAIAMQEFDVVLMDIQMPEMDGYQATAAIRERDQQLGGHTPIIAMTAHALTGDREKCLAAGMDDYVSKPVRSDELFAAIDRVLNDRELNTEADAPTPNTAIHNSPTAMEIPWDELLQAVGGNADVLAEIVDAYANEITDVVPRITRAIDEGDATQLCRSAHKLKSAMRYFQLTNAVEWTQQLENCGASGDLSDAKTTWASIQVDVAELQPMLADYHQAAATAT